MVTKTMNGPGYTEGGNVANCKSSVRSTPVERLRQRSRRYYTKLVKGMEDEETFYIVLTNGQDRDLCLRRDTWHVVLTRLRQKWPDIEAATTYEYDVRRGGHLNVLIKGAPGLTQHHMEHLVDLAGDGTKVGSFIRVYNPGHLASYLVKQLCKPAVVAFWPRNFRPVTTTRNWYPAWMSATAWKAQRKAERFNRKSVPNRFRDDRMPRAPHRLVDPATGEIV